MIIQSLKFLTLESVLQWALESEIYSEKIVILITMGKM